VSEGVAVCLTVTLVDGIVLARSAFHHSMNYRSVVALGTAMPVTGEEEKMSAMHAFTERIVAGRWKDVRIPTPQELRATTVLRLPLSEVSAKIRTGAPKDEDADYALPVWAGVIPLLQVHALPIPDPRLPANIPVPRYAVSYSRKLAQ
jgi:uncharacterized protein